MNVKSHTTALLFYYNSKGADARISDMEATLATLAFIS
jgi:hypothetical protein